LVAAVAAREAGMDVTLHEARKELGGRARTTPGVYRANWGPHAMYSDGPMWAWLKERGITAGLDQHPPNAPRTAFRVGGEARLMPPASLIKGLMKVRSTEAPVDRPFGEWAAEVVGREEVARQLSFLAGVFSYDHDPGRLSAAFIQERLARTTKLPPRVRYPKSGWATVIERLAAHARRIGVVIETSSPVDSVPAAPVVLALPLGRAASLLGQPNLSWTGTATALLDVAMTRRHRDPFIVSDLDASGWIETFSKSDRSLAPKGEQLVQGQVGLLPDESLESGVTRLESLLDVSYPGWRERETWRRRMVVEDESGALDLPGTTWRDRPAVRQGDGVYLVGDMVAAPGLLSEVSFTSAVDSVADLAARVGRPAGSPRLHQVA
jgi:phytoene dehydrogenase-like protein